MNLRDPLYWEGLYDYILTNLGLNRAGDYYSCRILDMLLSSRMDVVLKSKEYLKNLIDGRTAIVIGDSPGSSCPKSGGAVLIAADSSFEKCVENGVVPDIVTTDLDGLSPGSLGAEDVLFVVHAHGDNVERVVRLLPEVRGFLVGTAQYMCSSRIELPGGFTDGDRGVFLAYYYGAKKVYLHGFNFVSVSRWYKPSGARVNVVSKLAKLAWARLLLLLLKDVGYEIECHENSCEGWI